MEVCDYDFEDLVNSIALLNLSIEIKPKDVFLYLERGKLYQKIFNYNQAIKDFEKALTIDNCNIIDIYFNLALAYANKNSLFAFIKSIVEVLRLDDEDAKDHADYIFGDVSNLEKAMFYLEELLKRNPEHLQGRIELNNLKQKLNKHAK
ncbi:MAG: hypothetical protein NTW25_11145 [Candidatus Kapabacteria bacterium]|nr:hypothetical protein [Candidatus Kapabacteria bacterium]